MAFDMSHQLLEPKTRANVSLAIHELKVAAASVSGMWVKTYGYLFCCLANDGMSKDFLGVHQSIGVKKPKPEVKTEGFHGNVSPRAFNDSTRRRQDSRFGGRGYPAEGDFQGT